MAEDESKPVGNPEPQVERVEGEVLERKLSEHLETLQVALEVAGPVMGGVAGAVTSHLLGNRPTDAAPPPEPPPTIELPPGVDVESDS